MDVKAIELEIARDQEELRKDLAVLRGGRKPLFPTFNRAVRRLKGTFFENTAQEEWRQARGDAFTAVLMDDAAELSAFFDKYPGRFDVRDEEGGETLLHWAAHNGSANAVKLILSRAQYMKICSDKAGNLPLHLAATNGCADVARELIEVMGVTELHSKNLCAKTARDIAEEGGYAGIVSDIDAKIRKTAQVDDTVAYADIEERFRDDPKTGQLLKEHMEGIIANIEDDPTGVKYTGQVALALSETITRINECFFGGVHILKESLVHLHRVAEQLDSFESMAVHEIEMKLHMQEVYNRPSANPVLGVIHTLTGKRRAVNRAADAAIADLPGVYKEVERRVNSLCRAMETTGQSCNKFIEFEKDTNLSRKSLQLMDSVLGVETEVLRRYDEIYISKAKEDFERSQDPKDRARLERIVQGRAVFQDLCCAVRETRSSHLRDYISPAQAILDDARQALAAAGDLVKNRRLQNLGRFSLPVPELTGAGTVNTEELLKALNVIERRLEIEQAYHRAMAALALSFVEERAPFEPSKQLAAGTGPAEPVRVVQGAKIPVPRGGS